ncbi:tRNA (adenosine(37)-N6)-threonylcarbamoyltransferase complex dimerization subunit type 1 TsaB [Oceanomicrobium pacificus]|uniref:tRNA (Adenosine(37)-N6)-threonylcarbamoyltransferase complex dimerization subunit type 1 TsaB n=1 Tax=Oceanomicrobium pacificus TaxID=2692916 RepID=A0A6B0TRP3_9RHOB|nr:tRNA (adenosine(37)-N6)-threonylcarbamoyltransferase complex dimerization subunit type 1 TsaB [Oceanomicrobium pacificus]MXU64485.1 tRNA (adenosine(37)-N6)-threonylcarbamoyltransferase complex dimerization subunit type 1 TsaB [Oceanomicrobium pacificus]
MQPDAPLALGFDTSAAHCAAALLSGDRVLAERIEPMMKGQAERLFPMLEEMLAEAGAAWRNLDLIAVGTGPGNFTGIRISVAAARGLALSLGCRAVGVSRLDWIAHGTHGPVEAMVDARQDRVFVQPFVDGAATGDPRQTALVSLDPGFAGLRLTDAPATIADIWPVPVRCITPAPADLVRLARRAPADAPAPAPLYLRAPDAALPADPPPVILDDA